MNKITRAIAATAAPVLLLTTGAAAPPAMAQSLTRQPFTAFSGGYCRLHAWEAGALKDTLHCSEIRISEGEGTRNYSFTTGNVRHVFVTGDTVRINSKGDHIYYVVSVARFYENEFIDTQDVRTGGCYDYRALGSNRVNCVAIWKDGSSFSGIYWDDLLR